ncbi:hypothetical protein WJX81_001760 [Elliptochloris bilobata]|uniref:CDAN1-interacting nuclease 1 n=1 Tax=Elliptochloris bilobata TaxID=381761 RepID=A0AAW1RIH8_9CHLO
MPSQTWSLFCICDASSPAATKLLITDIEKANCSALVLSTDCQACKVAKLPQEPMIAMCAASGCNRRPADNHPGHKQGMFCITHKAIGMVDVLEARCKFDGCSLYALYGPLGQNKQFCRRHKRPDMVRERGLVPPAGQACRRHARLGSGQARCVNAQGRVHRRALLALVVHSGGVPHIEVLAKRSGLPFDSLACIHSQESQAAAIAPHHRVRTNITLHANRYVEGEDLLALAASTNCPPVLLLRRLLEAPSFGVARTKATEALRRPALLPNLALGLAPSTAATQPSPQPAATEAAGQQGHAGVLLARVQADIVRACQEDPVFSPHADAVRHVSGLEGEALLCETLRARSIAFWPEQQLRAEGFFKTPDVKLQVPLLVHGHVVNWIDSKATFGSARLHMQQSAEQYEKYVNRFGPGAVVYWFGYAAGLQEACPGVLLLGGLPAASDVITLPCLPLPCQS